MSSSVSHRLSPARRVPHRLDPLRRRAGDRPPDARPQPGGGRPAQPPRPRLAAGREGALDLLRQPAVHGRQGAGGHHQPAGGPAALALAGPPGAERSSSCSSTSSPTWILDGTLKRILSPRERVLLALLYWLNPWQLYFASFLWNPNYLFLFGAVHLWSALAQRERARFWPSFLHAAGLVLAFQIHASLPAAGRRLAAALAAPATSGCTGRGASLGGAARGAAPDPLGDRGHGPSRHRHRGQQGVPRARPDPRLPAGAGAPVLAALRLARRSRRGWATSTSPDLLGSDPWLGPGLTRPRSRARPSPSLVPLARERPPLAPEGRRPAPWPGEKLRPGVTGRAWLAGLRADLLRRGGDRLRALADDGHDVAGVDPPPRRDPAGDPLGGRARRTRLARRAILKALGSTPPRRSCCSSPWPSAAPSTAAAARPGEAASASPSATTSPMFRELHIQQTCPWPVNEPEGWWPDVLPGRGKGWRGRPPAAPLPN